MGLISRVSSRTYRYSSIKLFTAMNASLVREENEEPPASPPCWYLLLARVSSNTSYSELPSISDSIQGVSSPSPLIVVNLNLVPEVPPSRSATDQSPQNMRSQVRNYYCLRPRFGRRRTSSNAIYAVSGARGALHEPRWVIPSGRYNLRPRYVPAGKRF